MITIHNQGSKQFFNASGGDVVTDIDSNFTEVASSISAISVPTKASSAEVTTGTNDTKFVTPLALSGAGITATPVKANGGEVNAGTDDAKFVTSKAIADSDISFAVKATGAEINTGTDDAKFATAKAIADSNVAFTSDLPSVNWKVGSASKDVSTAGTQTIAHGLGRTPRFLRISMKWNNAGSSGGQDASSIGVYDGTTNICILEGNTYSGSSMGTSGTANAVIYFTYTNAAEARNAYATATVDGTNITLTWTRNGTPTETISFIWEVM